MTEYNNPYSPLKVFFHQDRLKDLKDGNTVIPLQVQLIISDLCNHNCSFCAYRMDGFTTNQLFVGDSKTAKGTNNPIRWIPTPKVMEILNDCKAMGIPAVQLTGGGEPTVHPDFDEICTRVHSLGLELAVVSNGVKITDVGVENLARAKWIRFSVDAGVAKTYMDIREVGETHWNSVWDNLRKISIFRDKTPECDDLVIGVGFVVTKDNWEEVVHCTKLARQNGANNIRISAVFQNEGDKYFAEFHERAKEYIRQAKELETPTFKVFDLFGDRVEDLHQASPDYDFCGYQELNTYIGGDQNVYRCCNTAYNLHGLLGSIKYQSFRDMWFSQETHNKLKDFNAQTCERCMFNSKNEAILYALEDNPKHVNYV